MIYSCFINFGFICFCFYPSIKANGKNIADITEQDVKDNSASAAGLMDLLNPPAQQTSEVESELSEAEESVTELTSQLLFDLKFELENQNDVLTNYWDKEIQSNTEFKAKLREQKILSLEDLIDARKKGIYKSDEEFIESLKCL